MKLYVVIPCYNEEAVLPISAPAFRDKLCRMIDSGKVSSDSKIVFVDDGSKDKTWEIIEKLHGEDDIFRGIKLSRNRGHQNALLAGLMTVKDECDAVITIDADLQDDIEVFDKMVDKCTEGNDVVYGVRSSRESDTFFKRTTAQGFYKFMSMMGAETVYNHADFRLMSRRAIEGLSEFSEVNLFLRGIVPMIGYPSATVEYSRSPRAAGESKYPLKKMISFATEGITSLSVKPLRIICTIGVLIFTVSLIMLIYSLVRYLTGHTVAGWTSLTISVWALGGIQLFSVGVLGEYVGKIYLETKARPRFIVEKYIK
ncbi:MAG: glycosyltransferase family 2 protein [Clostridia bacterium]|nr:glycosyltransferase family 2 protein [Clostridia bacterium]